MMSCQYMALFVVTLIFLCTPSGDAKSNHHVLNSINSGQIKGFEESDVVKIQDYYESLCPFCRYFMIKKLSSIMNKLPADRLDVTSYPYGNAKTIKHDDGTYEFKCQHGPKECYGNMLHACVLDLVGDHTAAVNFNACMMDLSQKYGSDDDMADKCGKEMDISSEAIKTCAKGSRGIELHKYYGEQTKKVPDFIGVPHVVINGVKYDNADNFFKAVCAAFRNPPKECNE